MKKLGYANFDEPSGINIYPKDFEANQNILNILDDYNARMREENQEDKVISYTDMVGTLMSSVTTIVDVISYVLVAFVAISFANRRICWNHGSKRKWKNNFIKLYIYY